MLVVTAAGLFLIGSLAPLTPAKKRRHHHQRSIFGNVKGRGHHTVVAQSGDGAAATVRASPFQLIPNTGRFTLQIRGADGSYDGPVVAAGSGRRVVVGFRRGARLGDIVKRNGFWVLRRPLKRRFQDRGRTARARKGVPIGARSFGLVGATATGKPGRGRDQDRDGIPNTFDVDVDGDRILNNVDQARQTALSPDRPYRVTSLLSVGLQQSFLAEEQGLAQGVAGFALNQNAKPPTTTTQQFEALRDLAGRIRSMLLFTLPRGDEVLELDCGGLSYCTLPASTGRDITQARFFPRDFDPDHDGFGTMEPTTLPLLPQRDGIGVSERLSASAKVFVLKPSAAHFGDVATGDTFIERVSRAGKEVARQPVMLNYTFGTVPALAAWSDGTRQTTISYPVPHRGEGTSENSFRSQQYPNGTLTFTVWRPQRRSFPAAGERGDWFDVGRLLYSAAGFLEGLGGNRVWTCPTSAYSTADPNLRLESDGLRDVRGDSALDRAQTLTFSVNVGACFRHSGIDPATVTASSAIYVTASSDLGDAAEGVGFSFAPGTPPQSQGSVGTWRFSTGMPGTQLDWALRSPNYTADHFGIKVWPPVSVTGGTSPPGWSCSVRDLTAPSDMWFCTRPPPFLPVNEASGSITLSQPGSNGMAVEAIAPDGSGQPRDIGYPLTQVP
jgi:hypothetical protein